MGTVAYGTLSTRHARRGRGRALAVGGVGFAGAASVTDGEAIDGGTGPDEGAIGGDAIGGDEPGNDEDGRPGPSPSIRTPCSRRGCSATATTTGGSSAPAT